LLCHQKGKMYSANHSLGEILQKSVFATRSAHRLQLEPLFGCNWRRSTISGGSTQYLQLRVYIDCNSNHCSVATEEVFQYQAGTLSICNSMCISIATRTTVRLQLKGIVSGRSIEFLQLGMDIDCNLNHCPVATKGVVQYQVEALNICNLEYTLIATLQLQLME
jgi:hypothetical protein